MGWKIRPTAEFAFVSSALLVALMGWTSDLFGILAEGSTEPIHGGPLFFRLSIMTFSLGLAGIGVGYQHVTRFLRDSVWTLRYLAGYLILADGIIHAFAFNDHIAEPFQAAFFAVVAPLQVAVGLAFPYLRGGLDRAWLALTAFLLAAFVATRTAPIWPVSEIEEIEPLGLMSKAFEVLAVLVLVQLLRTARRSAPARADLRTDTTTDS